ncbi:hypothetical protein BDF19DRAFT_414825 [Syncephalis fuscata]|nr:hypothetical protein BDF19DRAFT_414825 [Syncephalis fuscata]
MWILHLTPPLALSAASAREVNSRLRPTPLLDTQRTNEAYQPDTESPLTATTVMPEIITIQSSNTLKPNILHQLHLLPKIRGRLNPTRRQLSTLMKSVLLIHTNAFRSWVCIDCASALNWFYKHRHLTEPPHLLIGVVIVLGVVSVGLIVVQILDPNVTPERTLGDSSNGCLRNGLQWIPFGLTLLPLVAMISGLAWLLRGMDDIYSIRYEVTISVSSCIVTLVAFLGWARSIDYSTVDHSAIIFPPSNLLVINAMILQFVTIFWPVWLARREEGQLVQANLISSNVDNSIGREQSDSEAGLKSILSPAVFHEMLQNPQEFAKFKKYTIRCLCIENVLFYEGCCLLLRVAQQHFQRPRSSSRRSEITFINSRYTQTTLGVRSPQLQRRLKWFRKMFLREDAELQVNLSGNVRQNLLEEIKRADAPFDIRPLRIARDEIEELMLRDIYPRYILANETNMRTQHGMPSYPTISTTRSFKLKIKKQSKELRKIQSIGLL